jgi:hypothetical protein
MLGGDFLLSSFLMGGFFWEFFFPVVLLRRGIFLLELADGVFPVILQGRSRGCAWCAPEYRRHRVGSPEKVSIMGGGLVVLGDVQ